MNETFCDILNIAENTNLWVIFLNKKIFLILILVIPIIFTSVYFSFENNPERNQLHEISSQEEILFDIINIDDVDYVEENGSIVLINPQFGLKSKLSTLYEQIGVYNDPQNTIVIFPMFTSSAYSEPGFYTFYRGECGTECLTVKLNDDIRPEASGTGAQILRLLGYEFISDVHVAKNPEILKKYDKVILLHNEYVTQEEFDAITNHPKVLYLYPNALYGKVQYHEDQNTVTLIRGHGYPDSSIGNGFDWKYDNTHPYEFDTMCLNMEFHQIENGIMLNCYPEQIFPTSKILLSAIKDF